MKDLKVEIISNTPLPTHNCQGKCSGKNGEDGYCYHEDNSRHPIGACIKEKTSPTTL